MITVPRLIILAGALVAAALLPGAASAQPPTSEQVSVNDLQVFAGLDSPCPFDITFTGTGTVTLKTYYDNTGAPTRQSVHGALTHTISSAWRTLTSNGPAPVHLDLDTGQMIDTGNEFAFHVPGEGIIFGQAGRLIFAADGSEISFSGNSVVNTAALCQALSP